MNYGLYLSAAGMLTNMHRQDVAANNLANVQTMGFKRDLTTFMQRLPASKENPGADEANALLDRLGGGLFVAPTKLDTTEGPLIRTGNDLDLAIGGTGFFTVQVKDASGVHTRLSRDGRLTFGADGRLVTTAGGHDVLDTTGQPITLDPAKRVNIEPNGDIRQGKTVVGRIRLVDVADPASLKHLGGDLLEVSDSALKNATPSDARIMQGQLEGSNVDPVTQMLEMISASSAVTTNANLIHYHDMVMDKAVNVLGRVA
ncbi:MAG: flagellar hook-basal body complex protein [Planctomycetes bacterium]|nr:flagellar hook-basal body complex protein [Planctomycetota bacterium]